MSIPPLKDGMGYDTGWSTPIRRATPPWPLAIHALFVKKLPQPMGRIPEVDLSSVGLIFYKFT